MIGRRLAGATVAALLLAGACGDGDDGPPERARPAPSSTTTTEAGATTDPAPPLTWTSCGDDAECATLAVPVDHDDPAGDTIDLAMLRLPARGERLGSLFVNFGGPGSTAVEPTRAFPWPDEVRDRFDVVAVDPRGVGGSTALDCGVPAAELYAVDHTVEDPADADALVDVSATFAADCQRERGDLLAHVGTRDVARDLDVVRAAMGDEEMSYLGFSYGTSVGQVYAELFPERVRAMVLDGVVDPAADGLTTAVQQAAGFEIALDRWAGGCPDRPSCSLGPDPVAAVADALDRAETGVAVGSRRLGPGQAVVGMALTLYAEDLWPALDLAVASVLDGDGSPLLDLADRYAELVEFSAYFAVSCLDSTWPGDPAAHLAAAEAAATTSPRFGEALVNDYLPCASWPAAPQPLGPLAAREAPPILLVSTTGDPATPHAGAVAVAERLSSAALLIVEGEGHTIALQGDRCVDGHVLAHLRSGQVPEPGARC